MWSIDSFRGNCYKLHHMVKPLKTQKKEKKAKEAEEKKVKEAEEKEAEAEKEAEKKVKDAEEKKAKELERTLPKADPPKRTFTVWTIDMVRSDTTP